MFALIAFWISYRFTEGWWQGLWVDLGVTALGVFITVFLVNVVIDASADRRWERLEAIAYDRLRVSAARLMYVILAGDPDTNRALKYTVAMEMIRMYPHRYWEHFLHKRGWRDYATKLNSDEIAAFLPSKSIEIIEKLSPEMKIAKESLQNAVAMFGPVLDPEQLVCIVDLTKAIDEFLSPVLPEGTPEPLRGHVIQILNNCVKLVDSMGRIPAPWSPDNDPRYAFLRPDGNEK